MNFRTFQSINQFISRHSTEVRATVRLCWIKEKCLKTDLKCVNEWSRIHGNPVENSSGLRHSHRYVRSTRCHTSYSRCIISCSHG